MTTEAERRQRPDKGTVVRLNLTRLNTAFIEPVVESVLPLLEYTHRYYAPGGPLGVEERAEVRGMGRIDEYQPRLEFGAGFLPSVRRHLEQGGYTVEVHDWRLLGAERLAHDAIFLGGATGSEREFLEAVIRNPIGQVEVAGLDEALQHCLQIALLFSKARVAVVVPHRKSIGWMALYLGRLLGEGVGRYAGFTRGNPKVRVAVSTYSYQPAYSPPNGGMLPWDVVVLPQAETAARRTQVPPLSHR